MGGLKRTLPSLGLSFGACALALAGFPLLSGFWSEEKIIANAAHFGIGWIACLLVLIFLAGVYISRAASGIFLDWPGTPAPRVRQPGKLVLTTTLILATGAVVTGFLLRRAVEHASPVAMAAGEPEWIWRIAAIVASIAGILFGAGRVLAVGPVPSFASWPVPVAAALYRASVAPAHAALALSRRIWPEEALDRAAKATAMLTNFAAFGVEKIEAGGFAAESGRLAAAIWNVGGRLQGLETGKIYTYTRAVFLWAIFVICLFALIWR
jgi:NADH-quinone oxidoreductase subunit L